MHLLSLFVILVYSIQRSYCIETECFLTVPELIKYWKYGCEIHHVKTIDGYTLELHRIPIGRDTRPAPFSKTRPVVFIQHGLFGDSFDMAANPPSQSSAFVFADAGFDVWLGNSRGTVDVQYNDKQTIREDKYWDFTYEMSRYDLTASIDYIRNLTNQEKVFYVGHSQGTVIMFARLAEDPRFGEKIHAFFGLAPVGGVAHARGLFPFVGKHFFKYIEKLFIKLHNRPIGFPLAMRQKVGQMCSNGWSSPICQAIIQAIDGPEKQINKTRVGVYLCHTPTLTSLKDLVHWAQLVKNKNLAKFDYGEQENQKRYGQATPPIFDVSRIRTKTFLYWSEDDFYADAQDIKDSLLDKMNKTIVKSVDLTHFSHIDFIFGMRAAEELYKPIVREMYTVLQEERL